MAAYTLVSARPPSASPNSSPMELLNVLRGLASRPKCCLTYDTYWKPTNQALDECSKPPLLSSNLSTVSPSSIPVGEKNSYILSTDATEDNSKDEIRHSDDFPISSFTSSGESDLEDERSERLRNYESLEKELQASFDGTHVAIQHYEMEKKHQAGERLNSRKEKFLENSKQLLGAKNHYLRQKENERLDEVIKSVQALQEDEQRKSEEARLRQQKLEQSHKGNDVTRSPGRSNALTSIKMAASGLGSGRPPSPNSSSMELLNVLRKLASCPKGRLTYDTCWKPTNQALDECSKPPLLSSNLLTVSPSSIPVGEKNSYILSTDATEDNSKDEVRHSDDFPISNFASSGESDLEDERSERLRNYESLEKELQASFDGTHVAIHHYEMEKKHQARERLNSRKEKFLENSKRLLEAKNHYLRQKENERLDEVIKSVQALQEDEQRKSEEARLRQQKLEQSHKEFKERAARRVKEVEELRLRVLRQEQQIKKELQQLEVSCNSVIETAAKIQQTFHGCKFQTFLSPSVSEIQSEVNKVLKLSQNSLDSANENGQATEMNVKIIQDCTVLIQSLYQKAKTLVHEANSKAAKEEAERQAQEEAKAKEEEKRRQALKASKEKQNTQPSTSASQTADSKSQSKAGISKELSSCISPAAWKEYSRLATYNLSQIVESAEPLNTDKSLKQYKFDRHKAVTTPINAISDKSPSHLLDKNQRLTKLLSGQSVQVGGKQISISKHPAAKILKPAEKTKFPYGGLNSDQPVTPQRGPQKETDSLVPREIQAQGHRAEAAFRKAMEKGSVEVYRGRIMLIGQDRAGKTSLKKFLLGIPFDPEEESTAGIKVDPTKFEVEVDQVKNWQCTDHKKLDLLEYREDIARITAEHMKALKGESQETTDNKDLEQELNGPFRLHDAIVLPKTEKDAKGPSQGSKAEIDPSTSDVQQNDVPADQDVQLLIDTTAALTLADVAEKVEQCLQGLELNDDVKAKEVILSVWDFAGQNLYYASHSVFLSHRAVYVLVHNLSKDLSAQAKPYAKHESRKIELENPTNQTNLDNLLSWLVSVHCIRPTRDEASEVLEGKCPPYLRPPVFVVGTHADKPFKDIRDMLQYIQDSISGKRYDEHVIRPLYAVDNTRSGNDYGVLSLQNRILEVLKQEPYMGEKVPIRWFHFEKVVEALVANKIYHMELNELLKYTKRFCHIDNEDELKTMLKFYHDLGVIVKHGRTVVLNAQWLIDLFKLLIIVRPYSERDPRYSGYWQELKETGILRMDLVDHVFTGIIQKNLSKQDILKMMEDHGLIAKFSFLPADGDHQQEYFVPSLLKSLPLGLYEIKPSNCDPCPLYVHFLDGFVPHGLFAQLVSRCIVWCSGYCPEKPQLYQNGAMFFFIEKQCIFDLVLICRKRFIKIILTPNPQASAPSTTYSVTKAREVRVFLEGTLKEMSEELSWLRNLRYELRVACTHCLKSPNPCSRHGSVRCADDDCLYLLPLRPEEQLICQKNYAREPIKIYGLEKWLLVHGKESVERKMVSGNSKDAVKEGSPEDNDLERLANQIIKEWKKLGRRLFESDEALLDAVDMDNDKCSEKAYQMLLKWKAAKGSDATFRVLHDVLCHDLVNRRDLAEKFCLVTDD